MIAERFKEYVRSIAPPGITVEADYLHGAGPVLIDIAKDVQAAEIDYVYPNKVNLPGYRDS